MKRTVPILLLLLFSCSTSLDHPGFKAPADTIPTLWEMSDGEPVIFPDGGKWEGDNIYAPDVHYFGGVYRMWYGGQGRDGHDRIHYATSRDGLDWRRHPGNPVLDCGGSNHVNDPSVVRVGDTFFMYYTDAATGENDRIHLAVSTNGVLWRKEGVVLDVGPPESWDSFKVGRPSIVHEDGVFKMWYDGNDGKSRHVGYATSRDGRKWDKFPANPVLLNSGAVDVKRVGDQYIMVRESRDGTLWAVAPNETEWEDRGYLFKLSGGEHDRYGQVTPMIFVRDGRWAYTYFGGASATGWNHNRIMIALPRKSTSHGSR